MAKKIKIRFERGGEFIATLIEDKAPKTCEAIWRALPLEGDVLHSKWSGRGIFIGTHLGDRLPRENQSSILSSGYVGYWREWFNEEKGEEVIEVYYGPSVVRDDRGVTQLNMFALIEKDLKELADVGMRIWMQGKEKMTVQRI